MWVWLQLLFHVCIFEKYVCLHLLVVASNKYLLGQVKYYKNLLYIAILKISLHF